MKSLALLDNTGLRKSFFPRLSFVYPHMNQSLKEKNDSIFLLRNKTTIFFKKWTAFWKECTKTMISQFPKSFLNILLVSQVKKSFYDLIKKKPEVNFLLKNRQGF